MTGGNVHTIFKATNPSGSPVFAIDVSYINLGGPLFYSQDAIGPSYNPGDVIVPQSNPYIRYTLEFREYLDNGNYIKETCDISNHTTNSVEVHWKAATSSGTHNGLVEAWVNDVVCLNVGLSTLDNDTKRIDTVRLGAVEGIDTGTRGTYYFDAFGSRRDHYIGLAFVEVGQVAQEQPELNTISANQPQRESLGQKVLAVLRDFKDAAAGFWRKIVVAFQSKPAHLVSAASLDTNFNPPRFDRSDSSLRPSAILQDSITNVIDYTYDPLYRLTAADYSDGTYFHYTYDAVGNRLTQVTGVGTDTYVYDDANRLIIVDGITHTWDANGNLLSDGVNSYAYNHANRLVSVTGASNTVTFQYNGQGDRLRETVNGIATDFTMDLNAGLTQALSDGTYTYLYGVGRIAQYDVGGPQYFHGDALGSMRLLTDANGDVILSKSYQPYGAVLGSTGSGASSYGFTNEYTS